MIEGVQNTMAPGESRLPGQRDMWIFITIEIVIFSAYFLAYLIYRQGATDLFLQSQAQLDVNFGIGNTIILLTSSLTMAACAQAARAGNLSFARKLLVTTASLGVVFIAMKLTEWSIKIDEGYAITTNVFFSFYYFLTAIHVFHVLIGFVILTYVYLRMRAADQNAEWFAETGASYWHMVDFLWVMIFALIYVMR